MKTEDLIVQLARDARAVRPLPRPGRRLLRWLLAVLPFATLGVIAVGPRWNLAAAIGEPAFIASTVLMLGTALAAAAHALTTGVPGEGPSRSWRMAPFGLAAAWLGLLVAPIIAEGATAQPGTESVHWPCIWQIAVLGLLPAFALLAMLRRAAPLEPGRSALLAAIAGLALGTVATQFICPLDDPAHLIAGHAIPAAVLAIGAALAGRPLLNWLR